MLQAILFDFADTLLLFGKFNKNKIFKTGSRDTYQHLKTLDIELPSYSVYARANMRAFRRTYIWSNLRRRDFNSMDVMVQVFKKLKMRVPEREHPILAWMWYRPVLQQVRIEPGTHEMLKDFRQRGLRLAIVSNTCAPGHCLDRHLEKEQLLEYFPIRIYSSHTIYRKPHPEIFRIALESLGVAADQAMFVGDLIRADIKGARRAGMRTVWKPAVHPARCSRRNRPDHIIRKITELPKVLESLY
jgi:HAD superfamily hydrolase (TIGR01549 family)